MPPDEVGKPGAAGLPCGEAGDRMHRPCLHCTIWRYLANQRNSQKTEPRPWRDIRLIGSSCQVADEEGGGASTLVAAPIQRLNAICLYFTMFPLEFPLGVWGAEPRFATARPSPYAATSGSLPRTSVAATACCQRP
jgi:hypothetical protein